MLIRDKVEGRITTSRIVLKPSQLRRPGNWLGANLYKQERVETENSQTKANHKVDHNSCSYVRSSEEHARCHEEKPFIRQYISTFSDSNVGSFVTAPGKIALQKML